MIAPGNSLRPQLTSDPLKRNSLDNCGKSKTFQKFALKLTQLSCKKVLTFALLGNYFPQLFTEVKMSY